MFFAMSFALWTCRADGCGLQVEWEDAAFVLDEQGRLVEVRHREHADV